MARRTEPTKRTAPQVIVTLIAALTATSATVWAQSGAKHATSSKPKQSPNTTSVKTVTVNDLAAKPTAFVGRVVVVGVVGTVKAGTGFVLIDNREYKECGLSCLTEAGTKKIPVRWTGTAPKIEAPVHVDGTLTKSDKGMTFTATTVATVANVVASSPSGTR